MKPRPIKLLGAPLQTTLERLCRKHRVCGASLAILKDGVVHTAVAGWANAPERIEVTPNTVFQIGSIGKTFTATLAMQLVEDGLLDLDAPIRRYLPDFATADPRTPDVTIRQLMTHTSGMEGDFYPPNDGDADSYVRSLRELPQLHDPGEYMVYCNSGWVVLQRVIEVLRNATWNDLVMDRICNPLGMTHAMAHPKESLRFRMATGHVPDGKSGWALSYTYLPLSAAGAGSVLSMSATDLLRYAAVQMQGPRRRSTRKSILSQESFRAMQTPQVQMPPHSRGMHTHMGLSWLIDIDERSPKLNHDGGTSQLAFLNILPKQGLAYALLINNISLTMGPAVQEAIFTEMAGLPPRAKSKILPAIRFDAARYVGVYTGIRQSVTVTKAKAGHLRVMTKALGQARPTQQNLRAVAPDEFMVLDKPMVDLGTRVTFLGEQGGRARFYRLGVRMYRRAG